MSTSYVIRLDDVWVYYQETPSLTGVNLQVEEGEFLGLIGPNGGGKTTLLRVILGLIKPHRGTVEVFGVPPERLGAKLHLIGYIPQRSLADWQFPVSVLDVVLMGRYGRIGLFKNPGGKDKEIAMNCLKAVGMQDLHHRQIGQLSGGQQQRVFIARALAPEPKLLLLDEPVAGVDARAQEEFYALLAELKRKQGLTMVVVTHDVAVVSSYVEKIACLNQKLYIHDTPSQVFSTKSLEKVYGCDIEVLGHGQIPHRVLEEHK